MSDSTAVVMTTLSIVADDRVHSRASYNRHRSKNCKNAPSKFGLVTVGLDAHAWHDRHGTRGYRLGSLLNLKSNATSRNSKDGCIG